ncbi:MAG: IS1634 family transposase [Alphaproteobacteria bacterium]
MYLRTVRARGAKGQVHEYLRLVEAYWENGRAKQRVVCNLGRKDVLAAHREALVRILGGAKAPTRAASEQVRAVQAWDWGPMLAARALWGALGLDQILDRLGGRGRTDRAALSDRALVLVANRVCAPSSEHGLARWLETDFVCDRQGRRWGPLWRDDIARRASRLPRVRVELRQLKQWYRTLDRLQARQPEIEKAIFLRLRDLFSLNVDLVFYDLTSTYFEGSGPAALGTHGYSRDGKRRNPQVVVGCVLVEGWPIAHHIFAGNTRDSTTVPAVLDDLQERFGIRRVVFVGDRGMMTSDNVSLLRSREQGYILGRPRRRSEEVYHYVEQANTTGHWIECSGGITAREKRHPPKTFVQEIDADQAGVRIFVVKSDERLDYERQQRLKAMQRVRADLEALEQRVDKGRLKTPEKIGAAAERILQRHHGYRYYAWELKDAHFRFFEHPVNLRREQAYEGTYVIQTEEPDLTALDAVRLYKELSEVERAFAHLKDVIELRPIFHQTDRRVQAHIFVAALAFLIHRALEKKLKAAGLDLSATHALEALRTVRVVDIDLGDGTTKRSVTRGTSRAAQVLSALGISDRNPPTPPKEATRHA